MQYDNKEVHFNEYCKMCKHQALREDKDPCHDCLSTPTNVNSHKPILFENGIKK